MKLPNAKRTLTTLAVGSTLVVAGAGPAAAQPQVQDGLVNVAVGDVSVLNDVNVGVAADLVVQACDLADVGNVAVGVLAQVTAVDRSGRERTICTSDNGPVTVSQN